VDEDLRPHGPPATARPHDSDWVLSLLVLAEAALVAYVKLRSRFKRLRA
jgi:hypothetical protein